MLACRSGREIDHIAQHLIYEFELSISTYQFSASNWKIVLSGIIYNPKLPQLDSSKILSFQLTEEVGFALQII